MDRKSFIKTCLLAVTTFCVPTENSYLFNQVFTNHNGYYYRFATSFQYIKMINRLRQYIAVSIGDTRSWDEKTYSLPFVVPVQSQYSDDQYETILAQVEELVRSHSVRLNVKAVKQIVFEKRYADRHDYLQCMLIYV